MTFNLITFQVEAGAEQYADVVETLRQVVSHAEVGYEEFYCIHRVSHLLCSPLVSWKL